MHHPFTSPKHEDLHLLDSEPGKVRANAYDMVINGTEIGGGSIRIHDRPTQQLMFTKLGFSEEEAKKQFGFLMEAFEYGAPPHGGIAFGFDRLCSLFGGQESIRDFIAFPKNNSGRDVMIDAPSEIAKAQLEELSLEIPFKSKVLELLRSENSEYPNGWRSAAGIAKDLKPYKELVGEMLEELVREKLVTKKEATDNSAKEFYFKAVK